MSDFLIQHKPPKKTHAQNPENQIQENASDKIEECDNKLDSRDG